MPTTALAGSGKVSAGSRVLTALGLMSGTSMDGIDAAILHTDGETVVEAGDSLFLPYDDGFRAQLKAVLGSGGDSETEAELNRRHVEAVAALLAEAGVRPAEVDVIGFHGHTIDHAPAEARTRQLGDGAALAAATGIAVVNDFRSNDMARGGQGAPFAPLYHWALAQGLDKPVAVLNLGGIANVTWIGEGDAEAVGVLLAFDTGPGNCLLDEWMAARAGVAMDEGGRSAAQGAVREEVLAALCRHEYFGRPPPKSLDRLDFDIAPAAGLSTEDGAATLAAFTVRTVVASAAHFPAPAVRWLVTGGGRHNAALMDGLRTALAAPVQAVEDVGWDGTMLEAQAFAYLAVRSLNGLCLSVPGTTGVAAPVTGGRLHRP